MGPVLESGLESQQPQEVAQRVQSEKNKEPRTGPREILPLVSSQEETRP